MSNVSVTVLAEDFKNNRWWNIDTTMQGCPIQRAYIRAGIVDEETLYTRAGSNESTEEISMKVMNMFDGIIPVEDFTIEVEVYDRPLYGTPPVIDEL